MLETQILVIGAGITGASIARELSQYKVDVTVVEKSPDAFFGQTKAGHGLVYSGRSLVMAHSLVLKSVMAPDAALWEPHSLKIELAVRGYELFEGLSQRLKVRYVPTKTLIIARNDDEVKGLKKLYEICDLMGISEDARWITKNDLTDLEPNITKKVVAGVYEDKWTKTIFPPEYALANAENAIDSGVNFIYGAEVKAIDFIHGGFVTHTTKHSIRSKLIVNAAGLYADRVADMANARDDWGLVHNRTQMLVLDKRLGGMFKFANCIQAAPQPGSFESIKLQVDGNPYVFCGRYNSTDDKEATDTKREWFEEGIGLGRGLMPVFSQDDVIASFVGVRSFNTRNVEDHIIEFSKNRPGFLNVIVRLPGFCVSAAMAKYVVDLVGNEGLGLSKKNDYVSVRESIPRFALASDEEKGLLIKKDSRYGRILCRCESVTHGEIVEAIRRGGRTIQGIQFRTRAGMGRCQRNFCGPYILRTLSDELDIPITDVTKRGVGSNELMLT
jgi:glycerol-3-phosphate dehydrogenase